MNAGDDDIEAQAAAWIEENRALVDEWLAAASGEWVKSSSDT